MNPKCPETWNDLAAHPRLTAQKFDPNWYDGDLDHDLTQLAELAMRIDRQHPDGTVELKVLDDYTIYVAVAQKDGLLAEIGPSRDASDRWCYFVDVAGDPAEHYALDVLDVMALLAPLPAQTQQTTSA